MRLRTSKITLLTGLVLGISIATLLVLRPALEEDSNEFHTIHDSTNKEKSQENEFEAVHHASWNIKEVEYVPEYKINVVTYTHIKTGGELVSIHWDKSENTSPREQEKVFSIFFRTPVSDSTGVPHILGKS